MKTGYYWEPTIGSYLIRYVVFSSTGNEPLAHLLCYSWNLISEFSWS